MFVLRGLIFGQKNTHSIGWAYLLSCNTLQTCFFVFCHFTCKWWSILFIGEIFPLCGCAICIYSWISIPSSNCLSLDHFTLFFRKPMIPCPMSPWSTWIYLQMQTVPGMLTISHLGHLTLPLFFPKALPSARSLIGCRPLWHGRADATSTDFNSGGWESAPNASCFLVGLFWCTAPCTPDPGVETSSLTHLLLAFPPSLSPFFFFLSCVL